MMSPTQALAHAALLERVSRIYEAAVRIKTKPSMQPTPEAGKTCAARLRQKQRLLVQKTRGGASSQQGAFPPAPDPLAP